ncbi:MAG: NAD(P)H-dependent oxidoreductase subunit E [Spirochaetales bacterium]|nr:NAD(P)H-dependent oxidoreductase subunit E [Spirochaetales bacterium]
MNNKQLDSIIDKYHDQPGGLIGLLEETQGLLGYLPEYVLRAISEKTGRPLADVYGVATFYRAFSLKPRGRHLALICLGTACHVRGAPRIVEEFEKHLGVKAGETTKDKEFTVETVNCLGACALGPTVVVDGRYYSHVSRRKVREIIAQTKRGQETGDPAADRRLVPMEASCPACGQSLMDGKHPTEGRPSISLEFLSDGGGGRLHLSSLYGSPVAEWEPAPPPSSPVSAVVLCCPHCGKEFESRSLCAECGADMALLRIHGGFHLEICTVPACRGRLLSLIPTPAEKRT